MADYTTRNLLPAASLTEIYLRSAAQLVDIQAAATQSFLHQQSELLSASAEQAAKFVRQTSASMSDLQHALQQYVVRQSAAVTSEFRENTQQFARHVEQSTDVARAASERATEAVQNAATGFEGSRAAQTT